MIDHRFKIMCLLTIMQAHMPVSVERGTNMLDDFVVVKKTANMPIMVEAPKI